HGIVAGLREGLGEGEARAHRDDRDDEGEQREGRGGEERGPPEHAAGAGAAHGEARDGPGLRGDEAGVHWPVPPGRRVALSVSKMLLTDSSVTLTVRTSMPSSRTSLLSRSRNSSRRRVWTTTPPATSSTSTECVASPARKCRAARRGSSQRSS